MDPRQLLEIHAFLACQGPEAFLPSAAWFRLMPDARQGALVDWLLDPAHRESASELLGREWARVLDAQDRDGFLRMGKLLPCLTLCDAALGFRVLQSTAEAVGPSARRPFGEALLALLFSRCGNARQQEPGGATPDPETRVLVQALSSLPLDAEDQARRFIAMSQLDLGPDLGRELTQGGAYPTDPVAIGTILSEGHPAAIDCLLQGIQERPDGRTAFFEACKGLTQRDLSRGLTALGRVLDAIRARESRQAPLEALLRAPLLFALERCPQDRLESVLPKDASTGTLLLASQVLPGLPAPRRAPLCDGLLDRCAEALQEGRIGTDRHPSFVATVVQAAVTHPEPARAAERVRRMLLDGASVFRVHLFGSARPREDLFDAAMAFEQIVADLDAEFRRRRSLAYALDSVMPLVRLLDQPAEATWAD